MRALQYGTLSPTRTFTKDPVFCDMTTTPALAVSVADVKAELPVYDSNSDDQIERKIRAVQTMIEKYINRDTTSRSRIAYWASPQEIIALPYGPHTITTVEQRLTPKDTYVAQVVDEDYWVLDSSFDYLQLQLSKIYNTRITFTSGSASVDDVVQEAIIQEVAFQFKNRNDPDLTIPQTMGGLSVPTYNMIKNLIRH